MSSKRTDPYYQAQAILSYRDHSVGELRQKLARKSFNREQIEAVVQRLIQEKVLDDQRYARLYATSTLRFKKVGPRWLAMKLQQKRIDRDIITQVLAELYPVDAEIALVRAATRTWKTSHKTVAADRIRLIRFLASRGFSPASIAEGMDAVAAADE